jgi:hypothetical protein
LVRHGGVKVSRVRKTVEQVICLLRFGTLVGRLESCVCSWGVAKWRGTE